MTVRYMGKIVPSVKDRFPQQIAFGKSEFDMYMTQSTVLPETDGIEDTVITYFINGVPMSSMRGLKGHGYPMFVRVMDGIPLIKIRHDNGISKTWVELPYVPDYEWKEYDILGFETLPPITYLPKQTYWSQGRVYYKGYIYELLGGPWNDAGPTKTGYGPTKLNKYNAKTGELVRSESAQHCGRKGGSVYGLPERGRVEPEGLAYAVLGGREALVLNFACGRSWDGNTDLICYQYSADL